MPATIIQDRLDQITTLDSGGHNEGLDLDLLRKMFRYADGHIIRLTTVNYNAKAGDVAGTVDRSTGYVKVNFDGKVRLAHRLIWALCHGDQPPRQIDHIDCNRSNNTIENLRACTPTQNLINRVGKRALKGVSFHKAAGKFMAQIRVGGKNIYLGLFDDEVSAACAYDAACVVNYGEFARPNFQGV